MQQIFQPITQGQVLDLGQVALRVAGKKLAAENNLLEGQLPKHSSHLVSILEFDQILKLASVVQLKTPLIQPRLS